MCFLFAQLEALLSGVRDSNLVFTLGFGIGMHHAGLQEQDRRIVEELFLNQKIQVQFDVLLLVLLFTIYFYLHVHTILKTTYNSFSLSLCINYQMC